MSGSGPKPDSPTPGRPIRSAPKERWDFALRSGTVSSQESPRKSRERSRSKRDPGERRRPHRLLRAGRDQLLPPAERHDAVAAAGAVSDAEELLRARASGRSGCSPSLTRSRPRCCSRSSAATRIGGRGRIRSRSAWASRWSGCCCCLVAQHSGVLLLAAALIGIGLVGVSPGVVARGAHGLRRPARPRAVGVPGRRQRGLGDRAAAGGLHRAAARPASVALVLVAALLGMFVLFNVGHWYKTHGARAPRRRAARTAVRTAAPRAAGRRRASPCCWR